ncbi:hypothetical protein RSAG8_07215, partial [Rhizoctonia solani AG-8 WAC10335]
MASDPSIVAASRPRKPNNATSSTLQGVTPECLAHFMLPPAATLATFPPEIQAAVAILKASVATPGTIPRLGTASLSSLAPAKVTIKAQTKVVPKVPARKVSAKVSTQLVPIDEPFDDEEYLSDALSASESNLPVNPQPDRSALRACNKQAVMRGKGSEERGGDNAKATGRAKPEPEKFVKAAKVAGNAGEGAKAAKAAGAKCGVVLAVILMQELPLGQRTASEETHLQHG